MNNKDPLMKQIKEVKDNYTLYPVSAILNNDTIIPGISGKEIDVSKSYEEMKLGKIFRQELLVYKTLYPKEMLINNKDKYIIRGNNNKNKVSLLVILNDINITNIDKNITIFLNHKDISIKNIHKLKGYPIYTYGNNGKYDEEVLVSDNTIINRISPYQSKYCLLKSKNSLILNICSNNDMYTIIPNIIGDYSDIKKNLSNGSIILLNNYKNINIIIKYINSKGYEIVPLSELLKE